MSYKSKRSTKVGSKERIVGIDLFCGVGGLSHGLSAGGIKVVAGFDIDAECKFPYEANNEGKFIRSDVCDLTSAEVGKYFGSAKYRLLAGCAPCQPFSTYSQSTRRIKEDDKWKLLLEFGRIVSDLQPELVTMENVPQLPQHEVFHSFLERLAGYHVWYDVVDCVDYGIPQTRKRLVLLASKFGKIRLLSKNTQTYATVADAIKGLPALSAGKSNSEDPLHSSCNLSELNLKRIRASKPGGTWRDWPDELLADCHRKKSGLTYPSVYGRMKWDSPSPTITTQCFGYGNGRFGHPSQNRAISLREAAMLQTFPAEYKFVPQGSRIKFSVLGRLIGNAVPVKLGKIVADSLVSHVEKHKG